MTTGVTSPKSWVGSNTPVVPVLVSVSHPGPRRGADHVPPGTVRGLGPSRAMQLFIILVNQVNTPKGLGSGFRRNGVCDGDGDCGWGWGQGWGLGLELEIGIGIGAGRGVRGLDQVRSEPASPFPWSGSKTHRCPSIKCRFDSRPSESLEGQRLQSRRSTDVRDSSGSEDGRRLRGTCCRFDTRRDRTVGAK